MAMKIKSIRLQNIKSYDDETIYFNEGVNLISGPNGAGKTTIIESIGYALFDSKPGYIKEFIRHGSGTGTITVEFEANDDRHYRVVRKCGNVNSWVVFDVESDAELDLHTAADIVPWLKEVTGIEREQSISEIFEDVIGVGQGVFTAPFLETASVRRDKFNKMLKVEAYREAFNKTKGTVRYIGDKIQEARVDIARLLGSISEYDAILEKREEIKPLIESLSRELEAKKALREARRKEREKLRNLSNEIQKLENEIRIREITISNYRSNEEKLTESLVSAEKSRELLSKTEPGYAAYNKAKEALNLLEKQREERDKLNKALTETKQKISEISVKLKSEKENIDAEIDYISKKTDEYSEILRDQLSVAESCRMRFEQVKVLESKVHGIDSLIDKLDGMKKKFELANARCESLISRWNELMERESEIREKLSQEKELTEKAEKIRWLENERDIIVKKIAAVESEIEVLKSNQMKTSSGKCPFLDAPCRNIGGDGDLNKFFSSEIKKRQDLMEEYTARLNETAGLISQGEILRNRLGELQGAKSILEGTLAEKSKYSGYASSYRKMIKQDFNENMVHEACNAIYDLLNEAKEFLERKDDQGDSIFEKLEDAKRSVSDCWQNFKTQFLNSEVIDISSFKNMVADFSNVLYRLGNTIEECKNAYRHISSLVSKEKSKRSGDFAKAEESVSSTSRNIRELEERRKKTEERRTNVDQMAALLRKLDGEKVKLEQGLETFADLDEKISHERDVMQKNQPMYDTYMQHFSEARKTEKIKLELESVQKAIARTLEDRTGLVGRLKEVSKDFSQEKLAEAEKMFDSLNEQVTSIQNKLEERLKDLSEVESKLAEMEKTKKEIEKLEEQVARLSQVNELLAFIRSILNRAGERVSEVYRSYLATEANRIYHEISNDNALLDWKEDYEITLIDNFDGRERERCFRQLSGGEQMTAALAMRLSFLKQLSKAGIGFFDEPTTNLDRERRSNLANVIPKITGNFDQLFVISHDDSFDSMTENVIQLSKDKGSGTTVF